VYFLDMVSRQWISLLVKKVEKEKKKRQAGSVSPMRASGEGGCGPDA
jgi:hypothetical protein